MPSSFANQVYSLVKQVPSGKITTYGEIGRALNISGYQAIGQALRVNPYAPAVPCHRVVGKGGLTGGFGGKRSGKKIIEKISLLKSEGIEFSGNKIKNFEKVFFKFS